MEYTSKGDRYENLSPKEYLNVIRPYLRGFINEHKPTVELNNNSDNSNNSNNNSNDNNNSNHNSNNSNNRAEWKIQLIIKNNFISVNDFEDTCTIYSASKPVKLFMGSDTENIIDTLFNTILQFKIKFNKQWKHQMKEEADLPMIVLDYYFIIFKE